MSVVNIHLIIFHLRARNYYFITKPGKNEFAPFAPLWGQAGRILVAKFQGTKVETPAISGLATFKP